MCYTWCKGTNIRHYYQTRCALLVCRGQAENPLKSAQITAQKRATAKATQLVIYRAFRMANAKFILNIRNGRLRLGNPWFCIKIAFVWAAELLPRLGAVLRGFCYRFGGNYLRFLERFSLT